MPRIAENRTPAEPVSANQRERYRRMLQAAARLGADRGYDHVQMHEVAQDAGVAIATLYRYFPSKAHLFAGVNRWQLERYPEVAPAEADDRAGTVAELLVDMSREMARRPRLSLATIHANNQIQAQASAVGEETHNDVAFRTMVLATAGIGDPDEEDHRRVRLLVHCWYGMLTSLLNGRMELDQAEVDIRVACQLLISDP